MFRFIGVALIVAGLLCLVWTALGRRKLSEPGKPAANANTQSLEPSGQGLRFLGFRHNGACLAMIAIGAALLILTV